MEVFLPTKKDLSDLKAELSKTIYIVSLSQFLAIILAMIAILNFMKG